MCFESVTFPALLALALIAAPALAGTISVKNLRCEYIVNPMAIDNTQPRLSWNSESDQRGQLQSAYQIVVASSPKLLTPGKADLWDSGKVASDRSVEIAYGGLALKSEVKCYWKVRIWDKGGKASAWSATANWRMGLLQASDWHAAWVRFADQDKNEGRVSPWLRKTFDLKSKPGQAIAHVNAAGYFELYVNGRKVGADVLSPAVSSQNKLSHYITFDIAPFLVNGRNCIGLWLGRGWSARMKPSGPAVRVQCAIIDGDKSVEIVSDTTWKGAASPYAMDGQWAWNDNGGERYDAHVENPNWCKPGFDDSAWSDAVPYNPPAFLVEAQKCPINCIGEKITAKSVTDIGEGRYEIDFGTNLTGWMRLRMPRLIDGQVVTMHYADRMQEKDPTGAESGSDLAFSRLGQLTHYQTFRQKDVFVSAGRANEKFCSKFNYHGFRYVVIEGLLAKPSLADAEAMLIESDLADVGSFECSNDLFNRIHKLNVWTIRCLNLGGYLVDCPHRERMGYGDGQVSIESCVMNFWMPDFYEKWMQDWRIDTDAKTGEIPHTAPNEGGGGGPGWGGSLQALAWRNYLYYSDKRALRDNYKACKEYVRFLETKCQDNVLRTYGGQWDFIGDWLPPARGMDTSNWFASPPANELFNNCYRVYLWELLEKSATALGYEDDARAAHAQIQEIRPLIHKAFYDPAARIYAMDEQPFYMMPLMTGVTPESEREEVLSKLIDRINVQCKGHFETGMLGTYFLIHYLQSIDRDDLLFTMMNQKTYPGWGNMLEQGATTCMEQWNGYWSNIHSCYTSADSWFYQSVAGIRADESAPGFEKIVIKPAIVGDLTWAKAHIDSIYGRIESSWKLDAGKLTLNITIPANTTATVYVPAKDAASVTESGKAVAKSAGVKFIKMENGCAVFGVGSGKYVFVSK